MLGRDRLAVQKVRSEELAHRRHVDAVKTRRDNGRAGHAHVDFLGPAQLFDPPQKHSQSRGPDDRIFHQNHPFAFQNFAQRSVFRLGLAFPVAAAFDKRSPAVAIADQAFHAGNFQGVGHGVGRRLAGIGHGHDHRVGIDGQRFQPGQFFAQRLARQIHAPIVQRAGHVGKVNPLEKTMCMPRTGGERLDFQLAVGNDDGMARRNRFDLFRRDAQVQQGHAFARRGEQRSVDGVAQRLDAHRIAGDHHRSQGVDKHDAICAVEFPREMPADVYQRRPIVGRQSRADLVHEYFGVGFAGKMIVLVIEQFLAKFHVIGQLAVEGETEPFVFFDVVAFERLGVAAVVRAAGGVADVPDCRPAAVFPHDRLQTCCDG